VIDKAGIIRYIDVHDIDDQPDNEVLFSVLRRIEPGRAAEYEKRLSQMKSESIPQEDIVIFCTPWCPDCKKLREYLKTCNEKFAEVDISRNREGARLVREWSGGKEITPVIKIRDSDLIVEFDPDRIDSALNRLHNMR
jgi:glutaredoxin